LLSVPLLYQKQQIIETRFPILTYLVDKDIIIRFSFAGVLADRSRGNCRSYPRPTISNYQLLSGRQRRQKKKLLTDRLVASFLYPSKFDKFSIYKTVTLVMNPRSWINTIVLKREEELIDIVTRK
jgi:hypothetical protein